MAVRALVCPWYSLRGSVLSTCHNLAMWSLEAAQNKNIYISNMFYV